MKKNLARRIAIASGSAAALAATGANATGIDFSTITSGVDSSTVVTAIVAMGVVLALPGFAKWATKKVAGFFG